MQMGINEPRNRCQAAAVDLGSALIALGNPDDGISGDCDIAVERLAGYDIQKSGCF